MNYPNNSRRKRLKCRQDKAPSHKHHSRRKFQTADGKRSYCRLPMKHYHIRLQAQMEICFKNHFPSRNYKVPSSQYWRAIPLDGNSVNKNLRNPRWKIRFGPYCLWDQPCFLDGNPSPYY